MATNELLQKRFIYGLASEWYANKSENEKKYAGSIVFIKNDKDQTKGDAIWAQGAYFEMNNTADVQGIIEDYLEKGDNINIEVVKGKLTISAVSIDSISGLATADETKLVEAKAVAGALTTPVLLTLSVADGVGTFTETFKKLDGSKDEIVTAVFKEGDYIDLTNDGGLKISVDKASLATDLKTDLDYNSGNVITVNAKDRTINHNEVVETKKETGAAINPTEDAKTFDIKSYGFDKYGHISTETTTTVTLPDNAFKNDNTTYDLDATANATKGVDVNLKGNDTTTDTVTFVGGSNVEVALVDGKVEISSSYVNDNTTYTGENAIVVAQPETGSTQGKVTLKIDSTDKVLTQSASGLKTNLEIDYVSSTNKIRLTNGTDMISEFDASVFVKDSLLKDVEIVEENAEGTKGNYLKFTFETIDTDGTGESVDSTKVIYVDIKDFYVKTTVSKDDDTYTNVTKTGDDYKVSNVLGTISRNNDSNVITVSKDGLATVADIKTVLETIDSDLDAVKATGADKDEIAVVTGITQTDGKITAVDSGLAATKAYVDGKFDEVKHNTVSAPKAEGEENYATVTAKDNADGSKDYEVVVSGVDAAIAAATKTGTIVNQGANGTYNFVKTKDGLMTAADVAALMNESWEWGTIVTA